jgi:hypothetical protein
LLGPHQVGLIRTALGRSVQASSFEQPYPAQAVLSQGCFAEMVNLADRDHTAAVLAAAAEHTLAEAVRMLAEAVNSLAENSNTVGRKAASIRVAEMLVANKRVDDRPKMDEHTKTERHRTSGRDMKSGHRRMSRLRNCDDSRLPQSLQKSWKCHQEQPSTTDCECEKSWLELLDHFWKQIVLNTDMVHSEVPGNVLHNFLREPDRCEKSRNSAPSWILSVSAAEFRTRRFVTQSFHVSDHANANLAAIEAKRVMNREKAVLGLFAGGELLTIHAAVWQTGPPFGLFRWGQERLQEIFQKTL